MESDDEQETDEQLAARAKVRLVVMDVLMSMADTHPERARSATTAIMSAMQNRATKWAFRVHAGGSRT